MCFRKKPGFGLTNDYFVLLVRGTPATIVSATTRMPTTMPGDGSAMPDVQPASGAVRCVLAPRVQSTPLDTPYNARGGEHPHRGVAFCSPGNWSQIVGDADRMSTAWNA